MAINKIVTIVFLIFGLNCCSLKQTTPQRPANVPEDAQWYGGKDGGCWILMSGTNIKNEYYAEIYFESSGKIWQKGIFKLDSLYSDSTLTVDELSTRIMGYSGDNAIILKTSSTSENNAGEFKGLILIGTGRTHHKIADPKHPSGIPADAQWYGDQKNGAWMKIEPTEIRNQFYITVYFEDSLNIRDKGIYELDTICSHRNYSLHELINEIYDYGGDRIYLMTKKDGKNCSLRLIE